MQPSPIQLRQIFFRHISIRPKNEEDDNLSAVDFDFDGVIIHDGSRVQLVEATKDDQLPIYCITLRIIIKNEEGKICPYTIDMEVAGFFEIFTKDLTESKREELALINGCSMLYSIIREHVMSFTSRCPNGALIIPTVNFLDKMDKEHNVEEDISKSGTVKPSATKKKKASKIKES